MAGAPVSLHAAAARRAKNRSAPLASVSMMPYDPRAGRHDSDASTMRNDLRGNMIDRTTVGKYRVQKQLSLVSCLEDDQDEGTDINEMQTIVNDKKVQAKFFSALQAAAGPLGMAAPNGKNARQAPSAARARAASDPLSQTASHVFQETTVTNAKYKNSLYPPTQRNAKQPRGAASGGESEWEDYNEEEYGLDVPTENEGFPSNARNSKASKMNANENNLYKVAASSGNPTSFSLFPAQRSNNNNNKAMMRSSYPPAAAAAGKSTRFRADNDDYMDVDTIAGENNDDDEDEEMKPFIGTTAGRRDTTISRATDDAEDDNDYPAFGLTELGKMERQIAAPNVAPKEKTLSDIADPLVDQLSRIYEKEWEDVLEGETKSYRSTVSALGGLIQTDLISIAEKLSKDLERLLKIDETVKNAINEEAATALGKLVELVMVQKGLLAKLQDNFERSAKRDAGIVEKLQAIQETASTEMAALDEDWAKTCEVSDKSTRSMGDAKPLQQAFMRYFAKQIGVGPGAEAGAGRGAKSAGRGRRGRGK